MSEKSIWTYLVDKLGNEFGAAGLMGNLYAESGLIANNLQNNYQTRLGHSDRSYTEAVDDGSYTNFAKDAAGYGLAQWTYWTRKRDLLAYAKKQGKSIGDETVQLGFLFVELEHSYRSVFNTLKTAKTVREASDAVLLKFERSADMSEAAQVRRAKYGQAYYDKYAGAKREEPATQKKSIEEIAREVMAGKWGNGALRKAKLMKAGYNYAEVQKKVNELSKAPAKKSVDEIAREVIAGKWGYGADRKKKLTVAGYDYAAVQKKVNQFLK